MRQYSVMFKTHPFSILLDITKGSAPVNPRGGPHLGQFLVGCLTHALQS